MDEGIITTPVISVEMKHVLMERLEKEIISKLVSSSMSNSKGSRNGKKRGRESRSENAANAKDENFNGRKVHAPMGAAEAVVRSRFVVGKFNAIYYFYAIFFTESTE